MTASAEYITTGTANEEIVALREQREAREFQQMGEATVPLRSYFNVDIDAAATMKIAIIL